MSSSREASTTATSSPRWTIGFDELAERAARLSARARRAHHRRPGRRHRGRRTHLRRRPVDLPVAATASTPSPAACRPSAPITVSSPSAATSIGRRQPARQEAEGLLATTIELLHRPEFRLPTRGRGRNHRRRGLSAVGRPRGLADGLPQPVRDRGHADGQALSGARAPTSAASTSC